MGLDIRGQRNIFSDRIELVIADVDFNKVSIVKEIIFETLVEGNYVPPSLTLKNHEAQRFMDELWLCGLRPSEGTGSAGSLAATQRHLDDMRTIALLAVDKHLKK